MVTYQCSYFAVVQMLSQNLTAVDYYWAGRSRQILLRKTSRLLLGKEMKQLSGAARGSQIVRRSLAFMPKGTRETRRKRRGDRAQSRRAGANIKKRKE